jgi:hypothetical protein
MGMPSEFMTREEIRDVYGRIEGFCAPHEGHIHAGMAVPAASPTTPSRLSRSSRPWIGTDRITPEVAAAAYLKMGPAVQRLRIIGAWAEFA